MRLLYQSGILLYTLAIRIASIRSRKAKDWLRGRKNTWNDLDRLDDRPVLWFHCASLGEFEMGKPVMEQLLEERPELQLLVTFFSPSGYFYRKEYEKASVVTYLPVDNPRNVR